MGRIEITGRDIVGLRADNPGPFTLTGTNSWILSRDPAWLIDPGPAQGLHVAALARELESRGGLGGIALTHDHADHSEAVPAMRELFGDVRLGAARGDVDARLTDGERFGPLQALATPGHSPDHLAFVLADVIFTGDAVLGAGSVFISPHPGALAGYLEGLERLRRHAPALLLPGHGPVVEEPDAKLAEYVSHRLDRERRLESALAAGARTVKQLLDEGWSDAPRELRPAAAWTLAAHLDKLEAEGRLPSGVQRPELPTDLAG